MSFIENIATIMNADASLNSMVDYILAKRLVSLSSGDINEKEDSLIVYNYKKIDSISTKDDKDYLQKWRLLVAVQSPDNEKVYNISTRLQEYLENYKDDNVRSIRFSPEWDETFDNNEKVYVTDAEFEITYVA